MADKLSNDQRTEIDEYLKNNRDKLPICPTCKTKDDVIPSVCGYPSMELSLYAKEGKVKLSGCTQSYKGWCQKCQKFL